MTRLEFCWQTYFTQDFYLLAKIPSKSTHSLKVGHSPITNDYKLQRVKRTIYCMDTIYIFNTKTILFSISKYLFAMVSQWDNTILSLELTITLVTILITTLNNPLAR